ncbi:Coenzyme F420 hydrogenase/dehydrogenase, beta subunit C-terminal domain [Acinetobacter baumannii]|uniref:Coenzyme F420 hydrogenase/dehydrogenase, beta subunit C-terminal domain n=1 Tax=Acinetobacter baumannii TaxID=470 RepID=UPI00280C8DDC|nr:Coenzyme F420 hydrogenase/dehydrogenase, beta subunit C-terminal domain [Acinetobacter baumannii]MDQ8960289.1 Coenzyme F420 hydrogenase/dehydrogenase, beta subunit C-terminal domain [Acinetobacter baumannii]
MNIEKILENELCTGCGVCISEDKSKTAKMVWDDSNFLVPKLTEISTQVEMSSVCPFNPKVKNEDVLGKILFENKTKNYNDRVGFYEGVYAGYSQKYRETSSSGGIATYIFENLMGHKIVDHLFIVQDKGDGFEYQLCSDINDIRKISKTRYMPVTLEKLFKEIEDIKGKVAVSGVSCFVKAIRLKQEKHPNLKEKIPFVVGIICGGLKSKYYTDFLAQAAGCNSEYSSVQYRVKNIESFALDYKFSCKDNDNGRIHMVDMLSLGDMWGTGLFKSNACDFCDDVMNELADISLGDAWIDPYDKSGSGNSVVITRSRLAENLISQGINKEELCLDKISLEMVIQSQSGSFNHRHKGLAYRIKKFKNKDLIRKRARFISEQNIIFNLVQSQRMQTREKSLSYWIHNPDYSEFNKLMHPLLVKLKIYTKLNHIQQKLVKLFKNKLGVK